MQFKGIDLAEDYLESICITHNGGRQPKDPLKNS